MKVVTVIKKGFQKKVKTKRKVIVLKSLLVWFCRFYKNIKNRKKYSDC